ncbi:MAG: type II glyceraldehyde-3-phosphate dehydrogenase [Nitrososphaerales archaeon]
MVKIFINGFGNIGGRLASALSADKEFQFVGVAKYTPDERIKEALDQNFNVYVPEEKLGAFKEMDYDVSGTVKEAALQSDIVIDAAKDGLGYDNKIKYYLPLSKRAIFQGGEDRFGQQSVADIIHNSRVNYEKTFGKKYVIQGSCNVTGLGRMIQPLAEQYGDRIKRFDATLIRRWADLEDKKEVKDSIEWDRNPHHQDDVGDFIKTHPLYVDVYKVPSRMMHVHQLYVRFGHERPSKDDVLELFEKEFGVAILHSAKGTADVRKKAIELGFPHGDTCMVHVHADVVKVQDDTLKIAYSDDQTGMVIPENHVLLQAMVFKRNKTEAIDRTDKLFRISEKKKILMNEFK